MSVEQTRCDQEPQPYHCSLTDADLPSGINKLDRTYALQEAETEQYLQSLAALMKEANPRGDVTIEEGFTWRDADRHFCQMVNAKAFLQGMGGFSKWAAQVRAVRGMDTRTELLLL